MTNTRLRSYQLKYHPHSKSAALMQAKQAEVKMRALLMMLTNLLYQGIFFCHIFFSSLLFPFRVNFSVYNT